MKKNWPFVYQDRLKKYIDQETNWRMDRRVGVNGTLQLSFGELFVVIKNFGQHIRVRLEEIEAMQA